MKEDRLVFNPPPGWPKPPDGWKPPKGWKPDPSWPSPPKGWMLWLSQDGENSEGAGSEKLASGTTADRQGSIAGSEESSLSVQLALLRTENEALRRGLTAQGENPEELVALDDERVLQAVGIYRYHHPLENAAAYKLRLTHLSSRIAELVKMKQAIERSSGFTFDNSLAKGQRMVNDLAQLMLRAYNAEADNSIRSLRAGNVLTAKKRLEASRKAIAKLGKMMDMRISNAFHELRLEEIELTADWLMRKQEEKEAAREEKARLREERRVEKELAEEAARLEKEREHIENALKILSDQGKQDASLEARLTSLEDAIAQNDYRRANVRAGYVYVISNRGAFGPNIVKIGLTRRLEPSERISELSGAAVPFRFDVHALFFSEDAVGLESELHSHFAGRAVNMANSRKEFFFASPSEVREVLGEKVGNLLEFSEDAEATEYLQSVRYWPEDEGPPGAHRPPHSPDLVET